MAIIVGIAGVSRAGKTFLAGLIAGHKPPGLVTILHQDAYVKPIPEIPLIQDHIDWESPESIDFPLYKNAIIEASFQSGIVIAEGLLSFYDPGILQLLEKKIFITLPLDEFLRRKRTDLRWGKEPEWYIRHIWDSYLRYGQYPSASDPLMILDGEQDFNIENVMEFIG